MDEMINQTEKEIKEIDSELEVIEVQKEEILSRKKELVDRKKKIIGAIKKLREAKEILEKKTDLDVENVTEPVGITIGTKGEGREYTMSNGEILN